MSVNLNVHRRKDVPYNTRDHLLSLSPMKEDTKIKTGTRIWLMNILYVQEVTVTYYIKWVKTFWTHSIYYIFFYTQGPSNIADGDIREVTDMTHR